MTVPHRADALLLAMLAPARPVTNADCSALSADDWSAFNAMAKEQRLLPMLHWRDEQAARRWPVPQAVRAAWQAGYRRSAMRALEFERALRQLAAVMAQVSVPFIALKGSWLAWHAYPQAALRPMRDIDLWVPADLALKAHGALIAAGGQLFTTGYESAESALHHAKALPPIRCPWGGIVVEFHLHLSHHHGDDGEGESAHPPEDLLPDSVVARLGENPVRYLSATDTLLHLIVHSAYDHGFNNGPAVFDDIAFLLAGHAVDWQRFWTRAEAQGWAKGCELVLAVTQYQQGPLPIDWQGHDSATMAPELIEAALHLCLQPAAERATVTVMGETGGGGWWRRLVPPRQRLAAMLGVDMANPLLWLAWPWWLVVTGVRMARGWANPAVRMAGRRRALLAGWLELSAQAKRD